MSGLRAELRGIGAIGPGCADWQQLRELLATAAAGRSLQLVPTEIPRLNVLPPAERRRVGAVVRLAISTGLQTCEQAGVEPHTLTTVFASSGGDGENCHQICQALAGDDRLISPIRFHNSVNNAASGYWGIATGAQTPSTTVSAFDGSFAAGLLEAVLQLHADTLDQVLLIAYDHPYPHPLSGARAIADAMGVGLVIGRADSGKGALQLTLSTTAAAPDTLADQELERLRLGIPAARVLPLLAAVEQVLRTGGKATKVLEYLSGCHLAVTIGSRHE